MTIAFRERFLTKPTECPSEEKRSAEEQSKLDKALLHETFRAANCNTEREKQISYKRMESIISQGANVNKLDEERCIRAGGFAPIHLAAYFQNRDLIEFLLLNGANNNLEISGQEYFLGSSEWLGIKCPLGLITYHFHRARTPRSLIERETHIDIYDDSIVYDDLIASAKKNRKQYQQLKYKEREILMALMTVNYESNKDQPLIVESAHALLPSILALSGLEISGREISKRDIKMACEHSRKSLAQALGQSMSSSGLLEAQTPLSQPGLKPDQDKVVENQNFAPSSTSSSNLK